MNNHITEDLQTKDSLEYQRTTANDSGSRTLRKFVYYKLSNGRFVNHEARYTDALRKVFDEIITNAIDAGRQLKTNASIEIWFENDMLHVKNYGSYIKFNQVVIAFYQMYSSTNYNAMDRNGGERISGGINGVGGKLTNALSEIFIVESAFNGKSYTIKWTDQARKMDEPIVMDIQDKRPYVYVQFKPAYAELCKESKDQPNELWYHQNKELVQHIIMHRAYEIAFYSRFLNIPFKYNGLTLDITAQRFMQLHFKSDDDYAIHEQLATPYMTHVSIIVHKPLIQEGLRMTSAGGSLISILNGVSHSSSSNYDDALIKKITDYIKLQPDLKNVSTMASKGKFPNSLFLDQVTFIVCLELPNKFFTNKGQVKENADVDDGALKFINEKYNFTPAFLEKLWRQLKNVLAALVRPSNKNNPRYNGKLHIPAACIKQRKQADSMYIVEGNSAATLIQYIINKNKNLGPDRNGIYSTGGVPMNTLKHSRLVNGGYQQDQKLQDNKILQGLCNALGLRYDNKAQKPYYNHIVLCTDQDIDGIGKICSLVFVYFIIYFPDLVKNGFIKRFRTPIIRTTLNGKLYEFYNEDDFNKFHQLNPSAVGNYFKGLGTNEEKDKIRMAQQYFNNLISIVYEEEGLGLLHKLYGVDVSHRKKLLCEFREDELIGYKNDLCVTLYEHCMNESLREQYNNIGRMIPSVYDAMEAVHRKALYLIRKDRKKYRKKTTVSALAGTVKGEMNYNHGESSLEGAIFHISQLFIGSNWFPLILSMSAMNGSQKNGRKGHAAARYTNVIANPFVDLMFPRIDDSLLERVVEEGSVYEVKYYVPIIPRILMETTKSVATGWNANLTARDYPTISYYVRRSIRNHPSIISSDMFGLPAIVNGMKIITHKHKEICIGSYTLSQRPGIYYVKKDRKELSYEVTWDCVTIHQLPIGLWGKKFIERLKEKETNGMIYQIIERTADDIMIDVLVHPDIKNQFDKLCKKSYLDPWIEFLGLYRILQTNLNFYGKGTLRMYDSISEIFAEWYVCRQALYVERIEKQRTYQFYHIVKLECMYHFIKNKISDKIHGKEKDAINQILSTVDVTFVDGTQRVGYMRFNTEGFTMNVQGNSSCLIKHIEANASFSYIENLRVKQISNQRSITKLYDKIIEAYKIMDELNQLTWQSVWLKELDQLDAAILYAKKNEWNYEEIYKYAGKIITN